MDYRKINSHIILLAIVIVVGLLVAMVARLAVLGKGADAGTANLVFVIVLGICAVIYLIIMAVFSHTVAPWLIKKLLEKKYPTAEAEAVPSIGNMPVVNVEQIKQDADRQFAERRKEKIELFLHYVHRTMGPYVTSDELTRLDRCVDCYGREEACPADFVPIRPEQLKNADLFHFGWNMAHYFGQPKQDVVPWLKTIFVSLTDLENSYIKGKLRDYQTEKYIIPNIEDIPKYMAENDG